MIYRLLDEHEVEQFPMYIEQDGIVHTNSEAEEIALNTGEWYELEVASVPEYDPETQYLLKHYTQENDCIRLSYSVEEIIQSTDASMEDLLNALNELGVDTDEEEDA